MTSGINSKDAIFLALTGATGKTDHHADGAKELKAGPTTGPSATTHGRLLRLKNRSQYQAADVAGADARKAVEWAARLVDAAAGSVVN